MTRRLLAFLIVSLAMAPCASLAAVADWTLYARVLERHLSERTVEGTRLGWLDYKGLKSDPWFPRVVDQIAAFPTADLNSREEKLAFYINAYNILAIKTVLDHWPIESIKDVGNLLRPVWKRVAGEVGGQPVSLGDIEHDILRKLEEPRIHMAIVCASKSCPDLRREPYTAAGLDKQLDAASKAFLNNPTKGLRIEKSAIRVSRIFDWFEDDFKVKGGVETFVRANYSNLPHGLPIEADMPYDWTLNGG